MRTTMFVMLGVIWLQACKSDGNTSAERTIQPVLLSSPTNPASCVYLTTDQKNDPLISWCESDSDGKKSFWFSFFDAAAEKFAQAISIPIEQNAGIHEEGMPKVAVKSDGTILAVYETSSPVKENEWAGDVHYIQSFDRGKTWTRPRCVHADTTEGRSHSFASITRLSNGEIGACWLDDAFDYKKNGRPVKFASTTGKDGFKNEIVVDSIACECCRLAITAAAPGKISIVYRDVIDDSIRDISVSNSIDNGRSFSRPLSFSHDEWSIHGCPHNGPDALITADGSYAAWFTGGSPKGIYYSELGQDNQLLVKRQVTADGRNIQLGLFNDGSRVIAYNESVQEADSFYSKIVVNKIGQGKTFAKDITSRQAHAFYPVVKGFGKNKMVIAWSDRHKIYYIFQEESDINTELKQPSDRWKMP